MKDENDAQLGPNISLCCWIATLSLALIAASNVWISRALWLLVEQGSK